INVKVGDACFVPHLQPHRPPYAFSNKLGRPVPAKLIGRVAHVLTDRKDTLASIECLEASSRKNVWKSRHDRHQLVDGRVEEHSHHVVSGLEQRLYLRTPGAKHIVRVQKRVAVERDIGKRIQPIKDQIYVLAPERCCVNEELCPILPIREANPLQLLLVVTEEWVGDETRMEQVSLHHARNSGRMPLLSLCVVLRFDGAKGPAGVELFCRWLGSTHGTNAGYAKEEDRATAN